MPTPTKYTYSVANDTLNGVVVLGALYREINAASTLAVAADEDQSNVKGDVLEIWMQDAITKTDLDAVVAAHAGVSPEAPQLVQLAGPTASEGRSEVSIWPTEGTRKTIITPNWADRTTWFYNANRVVDEIAVDSGDQLTYNLANNPIVDAFHGKITGEDSMTDDNGFTCRCTVKVNDVVKDEQDPHAGSGGDYTIDYVNGKVTFFSALLGTDVVKVTYHYVQGSTFEFGPPENKQWLIQKAEVQFSENIELTDSVHFELMVGPTPYTTVVYKSMMDYINEANGALPSIPALGGAGFRGTPNSIQVFPWNYQAATKLQSSLGMKIRIRLEHDTPFGPNPDGTALATATFYCLETDESS